MGTKHYVPLKIVIVASVEAIADIYCNEQIDNITITIDQHYE